MFTEIRMMLLRRKQVDYQINELEKGTKDLHLLLKVADTKIQKSDFTNFFEDTAEKEKELQIFISQLHKICENFKKIFEEFWGLKMNYLKNKSSLSNLRQSRLSDKQMKMDLVSSEIDKIDENLKDARKSLLREYKVIRYKTTDILEFCATYLNEALEKRGLLDWAKEEAKIRTKDCDKGGAEALGGFGLAEGFLNAIDLRKINNDLYGDCTEKFMKEKNLSYEEARKYTDRLEIRGGGNLDSSD